MTKKESWSEITVDSACYYIAFSLYVFSDVLLQTNFRELFGSINTLCGAFKITALVFLGLKYLLQHGDAWNYFISITILLIGFITYKVSGEQRLLWICLFMICSNKVNITTLAKISVVIVSFIVTITVLSATFGLVGSYDAFDAANRGVRLSLGFNHPNRLGLYCFQICLAVCIIKFDRNIIIPLLFCITGLVFDLLTSKTQSVTLGYALLATMLIANHVKIPRKIIIIGGIVIAACALVVSIGCMIAYNPASQVWIDLNTITHRRIGLMHQSYMQQSISMFGNDYSGGEIVGYAHHNGRAYTFWVDNAYAHSLLKYGYVGFILTIIFCWIIFFGALKGFYDCNVAVIGLIVYLALGILEWFAIDVQSNYFLLAAGPLLLSSPASYIKNMRSYGGNVRVIESHQAILLDYDQ